jgi:hypothetical protein
LGLSSRDLSGGPLPLRRNPNSADRNPGLQKMQMRFTVSRSGQYFCDKMQVSYYFSAQTLPPVMIIFVYCLQNRSLFDGLVV